MLRSSSTRFLVVLFFIELCTAPFSSKHLFFFNFFLNHRSLSTQLFFLVVLLLLLLSMTALSYAGLFSLIWVRLFHAVFPEPSSTQLLSGCLLSSLQSRICSVLRFFSLGSFLGLPVFRGSVLSNLQGSFDILSSFFGFILRPFSL